MCPEFRRVAELYDEVWRAVTESRVPQLAGTPSE
jgi:hypothetical protein